MASRDTAPYARFLDRWPRTLGPGEYTDQASSFLPAAGGMLSPELLAKLLGEESSGLEVRGNPGPDEEDEDADRDVVISNNDLFPLAALTTGIWGPGLVSIRHEVAPGRMSLPVIANDADDHAPGRFAPFWERMKLLAKELKRLTDAAPARYAQVYALEARKTVAKMAKLRAGRSSAANDKALARMKDRLRTIGYDAAGRPGRYEPSRRQEWTVALDKMSRAVAFLLRQKRSARPSILGKDGLPFGFPIEEQWPIVAPSGNQKLPFYAYSELPMATCGGAGACGVPYGEKARRRKRENGQGWCYSFKAWRYGGAFARQFLNTLANYADLEFAIMAGGGGALDMRDGYDARIEAALRGHSARAWPGLVRDIVLNYSRETRAAGKVTYLRLFVDGDLGPEPNIVSWMGVCRAVGPDAPDREPGSGWVEVYGYTKEWGAMVNVDSVFRDHLTAEQRADAAYRNDLGAWPRNYTFNLSSGSVYEGTGTKSIRARAEVLPVARGYFVAVNVSEYIAKLETAEFDTANLPRPEDVPFAFNPDRIRDFLQINAIGRRPGGGDATSVQMIEAAERVMGRRGGLPALDLRFTTAQAVDFLREHGMAHALPAGEPGTPAQWRKVAREIEHAVGRGAAVRVVRATPSNPAPRTPPISTQIRRQVYHAFLESLLTDENFAELVRDEVGKDSEDLDEAEYLRIAERKSWEKTRDTIAVKGGGRSAVLEGVSELRARNKALALVLHEALWALNIGGSCPLVCGNCSDVPHPTLATPGVHRCASKTTFRDRDIHIGLH